MSNFYSKHPKLESVHETHYIPLNNLLTHSEFTKHILSRISENCKLVVPKDSFPPIDDKNVLPIGVDEEVEVSCDERYVDAVFEEKVLHNNN